VDDPQEVMAAAAVVSAAIALVALGISIVGLVRSKSASKDAQAARENSLSAQWKMTEHLEVIAEAQARAATTGQPVSRSGGRLSARLINTGRSSRLIVANVGTESLTVRGVETDSNFVLDDLADIVGAELDPGEELSLIAAITMGTKLPAAVTMRWADSLGEHERTQMVTLS
jgi:hypothetical protein